MKRIYVNTDLNDNFYNLNGFYNAGGNDEPCCFQANNIMGYPLCPNGMTPGTGGFYGTSPTPGFGFDTYSNIGVNCDTGSPLEPESVGPTNPIPNKGTVQGTVSPPTPPPPVAPPPKGTTTTTAIPNKTQVVNPGPNIPIATPGCTDPAASNYNPTANFDDGSCVYPPPPPLPVFGCTNPAANNYNPSANNDDGSCVYNDCPCAYPVTSPSNNSVTVPNKGIPSIPMANQGTFKGMNGMEYYNFNQQGFGGYNDQLWFND